MREARELAYGWRGVVGGNSMKGDVGAGNSSLYLGPTKDRDGGKQAQ